MKNSQESRAGSPAIPLPKTLTHQRFADLVLGGMPAPEAYRKAKVKGKPGVKAKAASVHTMASRLLKNVEVTAYMAAVRQESARGSVLSLTEIREFHARIVRTPVRSIDPNDPDFKDGDLILKYKYTSSKTGGVHEEIVKLDPLKAIALDLKLSGDDPEANALQQMAEAFSKLGQLPTPLPMDRM